MELEDFEPANEFEFDLSDVDVAAFESVATEVTINAAQEQQNQTTHQQPQQNQITYQQPQQNQTTHQQPQQQPQDQILESHELHHQEQNEQLHSQPQNPQSPLSNRTFAQPQSIRLPQQNATIPATAATPPAGKILLVPINTKTGAMLLNAMLNKSIDTLTSNGPLRPHISKANLSTKTVPYSDNLRTSTPAPNIANDVPKRKPCNCTKSQCLKLYCDCFANGEFCSGCNCTNCFNSLSKEKERQQAITQCLERNPEAFRPKIGKAVKQSIGEPAPESIERRHTKGCNCKRSGCLKNYCECYEAKILCSNLCKCCGCKNYEESFERKSLMQLTNSTPDNARGILKNILPTNSGSNAQNVNKCFITDKVIQASLVCLLQSAQKAEKEGIPSSRIPALIQAEMGKCLRMIVDTATESSSPKKR